MKNRHPFFNHIKFSFIISNSMKHTFVLHFTFWPILYYICYHISQLNMNWFQYWNKKIMLKQFQVFFVAPMRFFPSKNIPPVAHRTTSAPSLFWRSAGALRMVWQWRGCWSCCGRAPWRRPEGRQELIILAAIESFPPRHPHCIATFIHPQTY